ncbi:sacsin N-terminal ATP-binding-like domain-containing protein [Thalassiella azotivora]
MTADPFETARVVERVLAGWAQAPERFREDANAEEDVVLAHRDRVVVELAQNAADAAARAGAAGRVLLRLVDATAGAPHGTLVAANTGAGLDAAGVLALATLRSSAKRAGDAAHAGAVGRFGVGFAAVLAVTDSPSVLTRTGGVRFDRSETRSLVERAARRSPGLREEVERRQGHVPALRLPFPAEGAAPDGYDSAVLLPLRDGAARDLAEHLLAQVDDGLLLGLAALDEVVVEAPGAPVRRLADAGRRWRSLTRTGTHTTHALADRPTEERQRPGWSLTWALPRDALVDPPQPAGGADAPPGVVHAPTPTDEPLPWRSMLVASFPLDPTRRHVARGAATDELVAAAAEAYADLLAGLVAEGADVVALVPTGLAAGWLDAELREAALRRLRHAPVLVAVEDGAPLRPGEAVALEPGSWAGDRDVLAALAPTVAGLVAAPRAAEPALAGLGVRRLELAELAERLPAQPDAASWSGLYRALLPLTADPRAREALSVLPCPLADGRVVRGARGAALVPDRLQAVARGLTRHGLRVVAPDVAADPPSATLLERLGAVPAGPADLLDAPGLRDAVGDWDPEGPDGSAGVEADELRDVVLALVVAAVEDGTGPAADGGTGGWPAWLTGLPVRDTDGDLVPAGWLVRSATTAADLLDPDAVGLLDEDLRRRWPERVWDAVGVASSLTARRWTDVDLLDLPDDLADVEGVAAWASAHGPGTVPELAVVPDLDLVRVGRLPDAVTLLAADPLTRAALVGDVTVVGPDRSARRVPGPTARWLRSELGLAGRRHPRPPADGRDDPLDALPPAPEWVAQLDDAVLAALGVARTWQDLDADGWSLVLTAGAEPPSVAGLLAGWAALAAADLDDRLRPAGEVWALAPTATPVGGDPDAGPGGGVDRAAHAAVDVVRCDAARVRVPDDARWWQRPDLGPFAVAPHGAAVALADVLDVDLASEVAEGVVDGGDGAVEAVPRAVHDVLAGTPRSWRRRARLAVDGHPVRWWVEGEGPDAVVHATDPAAAAWGLSHAAGAPWRRHLVQAALTDEPTLRGLLVEDALTGSPREGPVAGPERSGR